MYNYNGDGVISLEEMTRYLTSVFKIMYHAEEITADHMGVSAETLVAATAQDAFSEAELEKGMLTFDEFKLLYSHAAAESAAAEAEGSFKAGGKGEGKDKSSSEEDEDYSNEEDANWGISEEEVVEEGVAGAVLSIAEIRTLTNLGAFSATP